MWKSLFLPVDRIRRGNLLTTPAWVLIAVSTIVQACNYAEPVESVELEATVVGDPLANCSAQTPTGCLTKRNGNTLITEAVSGRLNDDVSGRLNDDDDDD